MELEPSSLSFAIVGGLALVGLGRIVIKNIKSSFSQVDSNPNKPAEQIVQSGQTSPQTKLPRRQRAGQRNNLFPSRLNGNRPRVDKR